MKPAEAYILYQPEPFQTILLQLQVIIEKSLPIFTLHYKWRLPFYYSEECPICYLNVTKGYVEICFWLSDDFWIAHPSLISENRKRVKSLRYNSIEAIDVDLLINCLNEAYKTRKKGFQVRN